MKTKTDEMKELVNKGEYYKAMKKVKNWRGISTTDKEVISRAVSAKLSPSFYKQMGFDLEEINDEAIKVMNKLFK